MLNLSTNKELTKNDKFFNKFSVFPSTLFFYKTTIITHHTH